MAAAGKRTQLLGGLRAAGRLAEKPSRRAPRSDRRRRQTCRVAATIPQAPFRAPAMLRYRPARKGPRLAESPAHRCRPEWLRSRCRHWPAAPAARGFARRGSTDVFRARASFRKPLPLPVGEQFQHRRGGFLDRSPRDVEQRPIELGAQPPRKRDFIGDRLAIDIGVVAAGRPCSTAGSAGPGSAVPASHAG